MKVNIKPSLAIAGLAALGRPGEMKLLPSVYVRRTFFIAQLASKIRSSPKDDSRAAGIHWRQFSTI
jgi:hypothetical protein